MLDLAKHIVDQKAGEFDPKRFEDHYEVALTELINAKRNGKTIAAKPRPRGENVVDLMDALKRSIPTKGKRSRKASAGQKGNAAAHRRKESAQGSCKENCQTAAAVGLNPVIREKFHARFVIREGLVLRNVND